MQPSDPLGSLLPATASHGLHLVCPASSWYSPSMHGMHSVAPTVAELALVPGRHFVHTPADLSFVNSPTAHSVHELELPPVLKLPGSHAMQALVEPSL